MSILAGTKKLLQVFVSSTSDLQEEREAIRERLYTLFHVVLYEDRPAEPVSPRRWCEREIRRSAVVVGLLGHDTGTIVDGIPIVQWEFEQARKWGVWLSAFVKAEDPKVPIPEVQQKLRSTVSAWEDPGLFRSEYDSTGDLLNKVWGALTAYLQQRRWASVRRLRAFLRQLTRFATAALTLILVLSGLCALSYALGWIGPDAAVMVLLLLVVAGVVVFLLGDQQPGPGYADRS